MDRERILDRLRSYFAGRTDIVAAWMFGSRARKKAHMGSDVDVGVLLGDSAPLTLEGLEGIAEIQDDLEGRLGTEVDVVLMNDAAPDLVHRILRDGVIVHESDHRRRILFEVRARNEYWDLLPVLERYRRTVLRGA